MAHLLSHQQQLKNQKYRNWLKAGLGLKYLKEGMETFTEDVVQQQHADIINTVKHKHGLTVVNCGQCTLRNLQADHERNNNKQCPLLQRNCNCQHPAGKMACQNSICGTIYDQIILNHASQPPNPYWKNTDAQQWCTDAWSVARCFINAPGYETKANATDLDSSGLLHLFINSRYMQTRIHCKITGRDVFSKVRASRNTIYHSSTMEMEETELNEHIDDIIAVLQDGKELVNRIESKAAVLKLKELKNTDFFISDQNETEIIKAVLSEINQKENQLKETIEHAEMAITHRQNAALSNICQTSEKQEATAMENLQKTGDMVRGDILTAEANTLGSIQLNTRKSIDRLERTYSDLQTDMCSEIEEAGKSAIKNVKLFAEKELARTKKEIEEVQFMRLVQQARLDYIIRKGEFQKRLLQMYIECVVKVSPVLLQPERTDTVIDQLYVDPWIEISHLEEEQGKSKSKSPTTLSYREIFHRGDKRLKHIYIVGEAGSGKSIFCKNMVNNWCLAHSEENQSYSENVQEMKMFPFLFFISLRHNIGAKSVETMIKTQYEDPFIDSILEEDSDGCLILLDGLDEWTPTSQGTVVSQFQSKGVPVRNPMKGYTVVITSRPWKVESLGLKSSEIDQKLRLCGVCNYKAMAENTIKELNVIQNENRTNEEFENELSKCPVESEMKHLPFLLQQLICLWFDRKLMTDSRTMLYTYMLSLFFDWTEQRHPNDPILEDIKENTQGLEEITLPQQLSDTEVIQDYKRVVYDASRLAHKTLFSDHREASLSFDTGIFRKENIPDLVIQCCLKAGILSKEQEIGLNVSKRQRVLFTFVHKSVQEFLSAIYIFIELKRKTPELFSIYTEETLKMMHCIRGYLGNCSTVDDILELSNVMLFLCGFDIFLAGHLTKFIYDISLEDDNFVDFRTNLMELRRIDSKHANVLYLQSVLFALIKEAKQHGENTRPLFFLADVEYNLFCEGFEFLKYVTAKSVLSISIDFPSENEESLTKFLKNPELGTSISFFEIELPYFLDSDELKNVIDVITRLLLRCTETLKCLVINTRCYENTFVKDIIHLLPQISVLSTVKFDSIPVPKDLLEEMCRFVTNSTNLRQICLHEIRNSDSSLPLHDGMFIDLSHHHRLQLLENNFCGIDLKNFNVVNLEACDLKFPSNKKMVSLFHVLKRSRKLKYLTLSGDNIAGLKVAHLTRQFRKLLPCLKYLTTLDIENLSFNDTILAAPSEMKRLRKISLSDVCMNDQTIGKFIDSILLTPCNIQVEIWNENAKFINSFLTRRQLLHNVEVFENIVISGTTLQFSTKSVYI